MRKCVCHVLQKLGDAAKALHAREQADAIAAKVEELATQASAQRSEQAALEAQATDAERQLAYSIARSGLRCVTATPRASSRASNLHESRVSHALTALPMALSLGRTATVPLMCAYTGITLGSSDGSSVDCSDASVNDDRVALDPGTASAQEDLLLVMRAQSLASRRPAPSLKTLNTFALQAQASRAMESALELAELAKTLSLDAATAHERSASADNVAASIVASRGALSRSSHAHSDAGSSDVADAVADDAAAERARALRLASSALRSQATERHRQAASLQAQAQKLKGAAAAAEELVAAAAASDAAAVTEQAAQAAARERAQAAQVAAEVAMSRKHTASMHARDATRQQDAAIAILERAKSVRATGDSAAAQRMQMQATHGLQLAMEELQEAQHELADADAAEQDAVALAAEVQREAEAAYAVKDQARAKWKRATEATSKSWAVARALAAEQAQAAEVCCMLIPLGAS